jgi:hypothetical protein
MKIKVDNKEIEIPNSFKGRVGSDGLRFDFGYHAKKDLVLFMKNNPGMPFELKPLLPESLKQRGWFEGSLVPLITFYQEGMDHHNRKDLDEVREWLKLEFNGKFITISGISHRVAQSTKGKLGQGFLERLVGYIEDNYAPPLEALNPESYKDWRDIVYPCGGPDNYIDYLLSLNILSEKRLIPRDRS